MAIEIIPDTISGGVSPLKQRIFDIFKHNRETKYFATRDWKVLPSVETSLEIDFVILISPDLNHRFGPSVICLQVVEDMFYFSPSVRHWCRTENPGVPEDPRSGAETAMEFLRERFSNHFGPNPSLSLGYATVFMDSENPGDPPLVTGDIHDPRSTVKADNLFEMLEAYADRLEENLEEWTTYQDLIDILEAIDSLQLGLGRIDPAAKPIFCHNLDTLHPEFIRLTEEQMSSLKQVSNEQSGCVIDGAAGTGKTILAIELARQYCEDDKTVAFMCSNPNLSRRVERWAGRISDETEGTIVVGTPATLLYQYFRDSLQINQADLQKLENSLKLGYVSDNWARVITETIEHLNLNESIFDYLIVDEAQNLFHREFLKLMNVLLKDGLRGGNWTMFGDFTNQDLVTLNRIDSGGESLIKEFDPEWSKDNNYVELEKNCRNTHQVAGAVAELVALDKSPHRSGVYGPRVQIRYFNTQENLNELLNALITNWKDQGVQSKQLVLLSSRDGSEFRTKYAEWELRNIRDVELAIPEEPENVPQIHPEANKLIYSDVYDFQGLESDIIILVLSETDEDVKLAGDIVISSEQHRNKVLYTGMSRAKTMLVIFAHQDYKEKLTDPLDIGDDDDNIQVFRL